MYSLILLLLSALELTAAISSHRSVCERDPYRKIVPLSKYAPALEYCSKKFPSKTVTVTVTVTKNGYKHVAIAEPGQQPAYGGPEKAFWSLKNNGCAFAQTGCSCIQTTKTVKYTKTVKPKTSCATSKRSSSTSATTSTSSSTVSSEISLDVVLFMGMTDSLDCQYSNEHSKLAHFASQSTKASQALWPAYADCLQTTSSTTSSTTTSTTTSTTARMLTQHLF